MLDQPRFVGCAVVLLSVRGPADVDMPDQPGLVGCGSPPFGLIGERRRLFDSKRYLGEPGRTLFGRVRPGACSRAEATGEGAPTGRSTTVAVASRPIHTPPVW